MNFVVSMLVRVVRIHGNIYRSSCVTIGYGFGSSLRFMLNELVI